MIKVLPAALALALLGSPSWLGPARADSTAMELRDTLGMSNDWNHWKYPSQTWALGTTYFCNDPNCLTHLQREDVTRFRQR